MPREPRQAVPCKAKNRSGGPCQKYAAEGQLVCKQHGAASPQAQLKAAVRLATRDDVWSFGQHKHMPPGEAVLDLIASRHARLTQIADAIANLVAEAGGDLDKALTGDTFITDTNGKTIKTGEHVKALLQLETALAAQLGAWDIAALKAQIELARERRVKETGELIARFLRGIERDPRLALTDQQKEAFMTILFELRDGITA